MREQRDAPALERRAQLWFGDEPVDAEFHDPDARRKFERKAIGMMEIRLARRMLERPIRNVPVRFLDHRRQTEPPRRIAWQALQFQRRLQNVPIIPRLRVDERRCDLVRNAHPASVAAESIRRPLGRRREVELVIGRARRRPDERLETRVLPQLVGTRGRGHGRQAQIARPSRHEIAQHQMAGTRTRDVHVDTRRRRAARLGMQYQGLRHAVSGVRLPLAHRRLRLDAVGGFLGAEFRDALDQLHRHRLR